MSTKINLRNSLQSNVHSSQNKQTLSPVNFKYFRQDPINPQSSSKIQKNHSFSSSKAQQNVIPLNQLMTRLSHYRQLKQLPLNPVVQLKESLWRDSPCTVRCINRNISVDRTEKFTIGSIYHKDNIHEQKKVFTQSQKPELLLKNFRRQIDQAGHSKHKYTPKSTSKQKVKVNIRMRSTMPFFENRFYEIPCKTQYKYDRNGFRSIFKGEYDVKKIIDKIKHTNSNFTSSRRIDLALPLNFNPGPGKYFQQKNDQLGCETYRTRKSQTLFNFHSKSERVHLNISNNKNH